MNTETRCGASINAPNDSPPGSVQHLEFLSHDEKELYLTAMEIDAGLGHRPRVATARCGSTRPPRRTCSWSATISIVEAARAAHPRVGGAA